MLRLLAVLVLARLLAQSAGVDMLVQSCDTGCDESPTGDCSSECDSCVCCPHQRVVTLQSSVEAPALEAVEADFATVPSPVQECRVQDIFRIPKRAVSV